MRRSLAADPATGQPRLADHAFFYGDSKLRTVTDLAYAVTGHKGMGGTVAAGSAFITGPSRCEWLYVAMTRGRTTTPPSPSPTTVSRTKTAIKVADPAQRSRPAARHPARPRTRPPRARWNANALALPSEPVEAARATRCASRSRCWPTAWTAKTPNVSASDYRQRALANADHLAVLYARWADLAGSCRPGTRTSSWSMDALPQEYRHQTTSARKPPGSGGPCAPPRWPGSTHGEVVAPRSAPGPWPGPQRGRRARRPHAEDRWTRWSRLPQKPWTDRPRQFADPADRAVRKPGSGMRWTNGPSASACTLSKPHPTWAVQALGPCPRTPVERLDWQNRAAQDRHLPGAVRHR